MQTLTEYSQIPHTARYLGSEHEDGTTDEQTADAIDRAADPIRYRDEAGTLHYFDRQH